MRSETPTMPNPPTASRPDRFRGRKVPMAVASVMLALSVLTAAAQAQSPGGSKTAPSGSHPGERQAPPPGIRIAAVVEGDVITNGDVESRTRLFAMSTGLPMASDVLVRLRPQIVNQLIDERLRIQTARDRKIVVSDKDIGAAIHDIEQRNNMPAGGLRQKLAAAGVSQRTLVDQIRAQLGWNQVLRSLIGDKLNISETEIDDQLRLRGQRPNEQEFRLGEIFIPIDNPSHTADAERFAETVIKELRAGAPFPLVAAQFSQTQSALEGGERGWIQTNQMDPEVAAVVNGMPVGAISNPIKVAGGFSIVTLQGKRTQGNELATAVTLRQVFFGFNTPLDPRAPSEQQRQTLEKAKNVSATVHDCAQLEAIGKTTNGPNRPIDPGEVRLEALNPPPFRQLIGTLPIGKASQPLIAADGVVVVMVCSREQKRMATLTRQEVQRQIVNDRVDLLSRQMLRDLHRSANIDIRGSGA